jgi:histidinol dehydrogenase
MGDYASGTNHTLPTYGYARMYSGVSVQSYQKTVTMQTVTEEGIRALGPTVEKLASIEGLDAHGRAVTLRLQKLDELKSGKSD